MLTLLREKLPQVLKALAPLIGVVCVLQVTLVQAPLATFLQFLAGSLLVLAGMLLLLGGIDFGILPMGRFIGAELPRKRSLWLIAAVAMAVGFATTVAEPDVLILSVQVEKASQGQLPAQPLAYLIAAGVGTFAAMALLRVVFGLSIRMLVCAAYAVVILLSLVAPPHFVPMAYDAGSVTTGVLSAPVLLALALGLSSVLAGRSAASDGFGILGLASVGPIIAILVLGCLLR